MIEDDNDRRDIEDLADTLSESCTGTEPTEWFRRTRGDVYQIYYEFMTQACNSFLSVMFRSLMVKACSLDHSKQDALIPLAICIIDCIIANFASMCPRAMYFMNCLYVKLATRGDETNCRNAVRTLLFLRFINFVIINPCGIMDSTVCGALKNHTNNIKDAAKISQLVFSGTQSSIQRRFDSEWGTKHIPRNILNKVVTSKHSEAQNWFSANIVGFIKKDKKKKKKCSTDFQSSSYSTSSLCAVKSTTS